jgi:hypothetical protein
MVGHSDSEKERVQIDGSRSSGIESNILIRLSKRVVVVLMLLDSESQAELTASGIEIVQLGGSVALLWRNKGINGTRVTLLSTLETWPTQQRITVPGVLGWAALSLEYFESHWQAEHHGPDSRPSSLPI